MQEVKPPIKQTCQLTDTPDKDARSCDGNKENEVNAKKTNKRQGGNRGAKKGLSKRQKVGSLAGNAAGQESPPTFSFKAAKTSFRMRKQIKSMKQQDEDEKHKKRIEELVAYFKNLDEQKLEVV